MQATLHASRVRFEVRDGKKVRVAAKTGAGWQPDIWRRFADELGIPDLQLQARELEEMINNGITRMPAQQQAVFRLSRQDGFSYEEIAVKLNISKSTVKWHVIAGLNSLKQYVRMQGGTGAV